MSRNSIIVVVAFVDPARNPVYRESWTKPMLRHAVILVKIIMCWSFIRHVKPFYLLLISVKYTFLCNLILSAEKYPLLLYHYPNKRGEVGKNNFSKVKIKSLAEKAHLHLEMDYVHSVLDITLFLTEKSMRKKKYKWKWKFHWESSHEGNKLY